MDPKRVVVELHGEYDCTTQQVCGIWVGFQRSWRPAFLWRDISALVQTLKDYRKDSGRSPVSVCVLWNRVKASFSRTFFSMKLLVP